MAPSPELCVTAFGAVTSIGPTAVAAASAFRAGIVRPRPLVAFSLVDGDSAGNPVTGRPIAGLTDGFVQFGRWLRLSLAALDDARATAPAQYPQRWERTAIAACLPHLEGARFGLPDDDVEGMLRDAFFGPLLALLRADAPPSTNGAAPRRAFFGHTAAAAALAWLRERMQAEPGIERAVLVGADSTVDPQSLGWLAATNRLKTAENPVGVIPGEAGAAIVVERATTSRPGKTSLARILNPVVAPVPAERPPAPDLGRALASTVHAAAGAATSTRDAFVDLNGEPWRAEALGHCLVHLTAAKAGDLRQVVPAASCGEIGAASGLLALCFAVRAFARGYARSNDALVMSLDERGVTGAFVVARP